MDTATPEVVDTWENKQMNITTKNQTGGITAMSVNQTMSNSPGGFQSAGTSGLYNYGLVIQHSQGARPAKVEVHIEYNGETKEMTYEEFFTRLGFKGSAS